MPFSITRNLGSVIAKKSRPAITIWNRLEGRPRAENFDRALRAEVRDALWMLTRQWQMGEFQGDDAGSPIDVRVHLETTKLQKYQAVLGPVEPFDDQIPLEAHVERMAVPIEQGGHEIALDLRLLLGRQWLKLIRTVSPAPLVAEQFIGRYPIHLPDPRDLDDASTCAHPEAWSSFTAVATRRMDGVKLLDHLASAANHAYDGIPALVGMEGQVDVVAERFVRWFRRVFHQPEGPGAWQKERLEYQFAVSAPYGEVEKVLVAEEYYQGHLDWYNFDVDPARSTLGDVDPAAVPPKPHTLSMLPTQATFNGMPNTRWWRFEDSRTNFGDIKPDTTDLAKLLLIEFGLVFANDWFVVPFTVPAATIAEIQGMAVTNVFGERTWVEAAGRGDDDDWQRWAMFLVSIRGKGHEPADRSLVLPPAARQVLEGRPLEQVMLGRDEMANMVWGIEQTIALPSGDPANGREAAEQTRVFYEADLERRLGAPPEPLPPAEGAKIRYKVMSSVPENWIPLIPVHVAGNNREVQLQRAAMLRIMEGDTAPTPDPVRPRTSLLRPGLEDTPQTGYLLHEEEVPRAGTVVSTSFQRTRWNAGRTFVWLGVRKQTGRGEGSSGLAFDYLADVPPPKD
ncbi:hypothetical protein EV646_113191 [Kribbella antiqua]|uniref:Uncharacterized protein n=1 Tax=Kribbella antiqua TaxID=2512217 RepID=A0A4R2IFH3_9ACTN|nr:hypothetical protein [Kribbella antiqua]TCO42569.1 hypothetical protein EV646_113191 [Kribbella antiqua]